MILEYFVTSDKLSPREVATILIQVFGVVILLNPQFFGNSHVPANATAAQRNHYMIDYVLGITFGLLYSFTGAMKYITIRAIGDNVHSSIKIYYSGTIGLAATIVICLFTNPEVYKVWDIGTKYYTIDPRQLVVYCIVGFSSYVAKATQILALSAVKSGTLAAFQNISVVFGFLFDIYYFKRTIFWSDYLGASMIVVFTTMQSIFSNFDNKDSNADRIKEVKREIEESRAREEGRTRTA